MRVTWKSIIPSCCRRHKRKPKTGNKKPVVKQSRTCQRLSFSDLSNPGTPQDLSISVVGSNLHVFTFDELRAITHNFSAANFLGEGGFGPVHKGFIGDKLKSGLGALPVAIKLLDLSGTQGHKEWLSEIIFLGQLRHPHLVKLIGYCWEGEHRLLVYEYMTMGSLENHLFRSAGLSWSIRIKIAVGAAKGLAFLHEEDKPVIYRDFKASNILLDSDYTAKLSDFGLAKDGPEGDKTHVSTRIMGTHGYAAPEYIMTGHLTTMSDVYSFGVVLLELLTGKRSTDKCGRNESQNLIEWAKPVLRDPQKLNLIIDPSLKDQTPLKGLESAAALAYRCLSHYPKQRPTMTLVVEILENILENDDVSSTPVFYPISNQNIEKANLKYEIELEEYRYSPSPQWRQRNRLGLSPSFYSDGSLYSIKNGSKSLQHF